LGKIHKESEGQVDRFKDAAREAGADESEDHFKARLRKIAKAKVSHDPPSEPTGSDDNEKPGR